MTLTSDVLALHPSTQVHVPAAGADLGGLYHTVLHQLAASVESLVAHAFAAHASRLNIPLPTAIEEALTRRSGESEGAEPDTLTATGNTGLDFLNEHLQRSAAAFPQPLAVPTPPWLQPFTLPEKVRFTRTPDPVLRWERSAPTVEELAAAAREAARLAAEQAARVADEERERARRHAAANDPALPAWRRPFTLPPGVRYTRTPDLKVRKADASGSESVLCEADRPLRDDVRSAPGSIDATTEGFASLDATIVGAMSLVPPGNIASTGVAAMATARDAAPERDEACPALVWDGFSLSTSIEHRPALQGELPNWIAPARLQAKAVEPRRPMTVAAMSALFEDADSDGSAVFDRSAFLPDLAEAASGLVLVEGEAAILFGGDPVDEAQALPAPAPAERRAFGSHGIPSFVGAVHYDGDPESYEHPSIELLAPPQKQSGLTVTREGLEQNARLLEGVLEDFGVRGEIIAVRPGPVVTLYEFEPAPGVKSSRVMNLADDIARSMSAISARVAVVQGRNVIGIELPNERRETVFLRELVGSEEFDGSNHKLAIALGKTIGGESVIVDLARMPHLLVAGTTGSGKSVAINTMILSLLYRMRPEQCRLIMVDPKMLELSIYDGIPHLLTPVVTDSKKAVIALKWAVREMEDRYKKMAKVGVRNIDGFNARVTEAQARDEVITRTVQQGFDRETGEAVFVTEEMDLTTLPYIVIIVDEMADLMMVAGKEIEGAIQRLAQMARAAGIHLIMATQRPSVDVITGTIKANFPTRISFQVTSKIDSRTILGEQGAEQLLGQGDMLHMAGGGRIVRVHGPFVSDGEVEKVVWHLKSQGHPEYLDVVTADDEEAPQEDDAPPPATDSAVFDRGSFGEDSADLYDQGVKIVLRDKKCSTSYIQRRLQVGYNKAASIVERMEKEGLVGPANGTGKREILNFSRDHARVIMMPGGED